MKYQPEGINRINNGTTTGNFSQSYHDASSHSQGPAQASLFSSGTEKKILQAMYNYQARTESETSFSKGDQMELLDDSHPDWWLVRMANGCEGYVPYNFVARCDTIESKDWFFGKITRKDAERHLKLPHSGSGTFLIRESETE